MFCEVRSPSREFAVRFRSKIAGEKLAKDKRPTRRRSSEKQPAGCRPVRGLKKSGKQRKRRAKSGPEPAISKASLFAVERRRWEQDRAQLEEQLARAQKMESLGMIAGGLAHDFNNFLEVILGFASLARHRLSPTEEIQEPVRMIEEAARRAADLTAQLLELIRNEPEPRESSDPQQALRHVLTIVRRTFDRKIRLECRIDPELPWVRCDGQRLEQAILNLAINARDAMPDGGTLTISALSRTIMSGESRAAGDYLQIAAEDTGKGMPPEILRRIFEPLFTTKPEGEGTGLGLTMVQKTVTAAGGFIEVESKPGEGSSFVLFFPAARRHADAAGSSVPVLSRGRGTVLIVDDEPMVRAFVKRGLEQLGYNSLEAEDGTKACEIYAAHRGEIACVILDMVMPEMSGLETYERLREMDPGIKVILSSGYSRGGLGGAAQSAEFLGKPYTLESLSVAIRKVRKEKEVHKAH